MWWRVWQHHLFQQRSNLKQNSEEQLRTTTVTTGERITTETKSKLSKVLKNTPTSQIESSELQPHEDLCSPTSPPPGQVINTMSVTVLTTNSASQHFWCHQTSWLSSRLESKSWLVHGKSWHHSQRRENIKVLHRKITKVLVTLTHNLKFKFLFLVVPLKIKLNDVSVIINNYVTKEREGVVWMEQHYMCVTVTTS